MKHSKSDRFHKYRPIETLRFETEQQSYTAFGGLIVFQKLFAQLNFKQQLKDCFKPLPGQVGQSHLIMLTLIVHIILGYRALRDIAFYRDDPMVKRLLGLDILPSVSTISRTLASSSEQQSDQLRQCNRTLVASRIKAQGLVRVTLDFDGSVLSTTRHAQGSAVGFNKKKKGARSDYPLFCTIVQTGQVFDFYHRPGNVHDSNGASEFMLHCITQLRQLVGSNIIIESRMDSAFFSDAIVTQLADMNIEFTQSVPFERFTALKAQIEQINQWTPIDDEHACFELDWKPASWQSNDFRFIAIRQRVKKQIKGPLQLDLFVPYDDEFEYKVILVHKKGVAKNILLFHNGRGSQEGIFAELKSQAQMDYVPTKTKVGNQLYLLATIFAHNLTRELQMQAHPQTRGTTRQRVALWVFEKIGTLRKKIVQCAGRITRPNGKTTLTISCNEAVKDQIQHFINELTPV